MDKRHLKPYLLVRVQRDGYSHIGELMSFPTPEDTIMVRAVPGHSGTMDELPVTAILSIAEGKRWWIHYANVEGTTRGFPVDMLRRENAAPVNFEIDAEFSTARIKNGESPDDLLVIAKASLNIEPLWNTARWESMGWKITEMMSQQVTR